MAANKNNNLNEIPENKYDIKNLESVLQKGLQINDLQLINYIATDLLPPGQNFGSTIIKLDVTIRKKKNSAEETMHLVAKLPIEAKRPIFNWSDVFRKEVFMYVELIPLYKSLEKEMGVQHVLNLLPKYIGHRYSLDEVNGEIDENSLLIMENLKLRGYYTRNRQIRLDLRHSEKALSALAKFHALGIILKNKRPDDFKRAVSKAKIQGVDYEQLDEGMNGILNAFQKNACFSKHLSKIEESFTNFKGGTTYKSTPIEPWATIIHGDLWVHNMLFHKGTNGDVDDVKFIDFQNYLYNSPLKDLPNLLSVNVQVEVLKSHVNELLDLYYGTFVGMLKQMGLDSEFSRDSFDRELKRQALNEFPFVAFAIKFSACVTEEERENNEKILATILESNCSDAYKELLLELVSFYERMDWF